MACVMACSSAALASRAQNVPVTPFGNLAVAFEAGVTGIGIEVATPLHRCLVLRTGLTVMPLNFNARFDIDYGDGERSMDGLIASHPWLRDELRDRGLPVTSKDLPEDVDFTARFGLLRGKCGVAVLSRGYKRKTRGFVVADSKATALTVGDEPYQMKRKFPDVTVAVDRNRRNGIRQLTEGERGRKVDVVLLDDAFQHRYVKPGVNILLVDYHRLIIYDELLPAGRLREQLSGKGIEFEVQGETLRIGNRAFMTASSLSPDLETKIASWQAEGKSIVFYGNREGVIAIIAIADKIKESSHEAIARLRKLGIEVYMLTGDDTATATSVAQAVGITRFRANALPQEKEDFVGSLQSEGKTVAMVGDGINDSQALAQADVSIAMGQGTDIAMQVAMVTLISSDLRLLSRAVLLSRRTMRIVRENLFWAFVYNVVCIPVAAGVLFPINGWLLNPMWASAAMAFSSRDVFRRLSFISLPRRSILMCIIFSPAGCRLLVSTNLVILCRMSLGCVFQGKRAKRCDFVQTMLSRLSLNISYLQASSRASLFPRQMNVHSVMVLKVRVYRCVSPKMRSGCNISGACMISVIEYPLSSANPVALIVPFNRKYILSQTSPSRTMFFPLP